MAEFKCGGKELEKVLYYYGYSYDGIANEFKIICPFHQDLNPSMKIDLVEGTFFCFGCGAAGDALTFVKMINKDKNDLEALLLYFKILKSEKCSRLNLGDRVKKEGKCSKQAYQEAHDYYYGLQQNDWAIDDGKEINEAREYMLERGFFVATLNSCKARITYNRSYPIIFPMLDNGKFHGWVCRTTDKKVEAKRKYLYNEGFARKDTLVGTYGSKDYVIVVEGYMDRLKMLQNLKVLGIKEDVVAILGWKMSDRQIQKLRDAGIEYVISALDNDECGRKGTSYIATKFPMTRFCYVKGTKDPGEMEDRQFEKMYNKTIHTLKVNRKGESSNGNFK